MWATARSTIWCTARISSPATVPKATAPMCGRSSSAYARNSATWTRISIRFTIMPDSATAGLPAHSRQEIVAAAAAPTRAPRPRYYRSLTAKAVVMTVIFLAVPLIIYDQFRAADDIQNAALLRSVHEHGHVIAAALAPTLGSVKPPLPQLGQDLARFADDFTNVKLLFAPGGTPGFFYVASWPPGPAPQLDAERETLRQQGILDQLSTTCDGEFPMAVRYRTPGGDDEVVTSVTPLKTMAGCWVVVTSSSALSPPGSTLGRPYWASSEVRFAAAIYLAMVLLTFTTFWSIRRGLRRCAERARMIPERRSSGGSSFRAQNDVPELADVAEEFDHMVEVLDASARDIRRAAEDNAHAFKTPIAVIRQSLEPVKRAIAAENRRGLRAIGLIESSLDKLDGLLASARPLDEATADLMEMPRTDIDLSRVLGRLLQAHADVFVERHLRLKGHIAPGVMIHANEEMVETVIENLLDNAVSFSPEGESVGVRLEAADGVAELLIGDNGPGVPTENLARIFDRYFSQRTPPDGAESQ